LLQQGPALGTRQHLERQSSQVAVRGQQEAVAVAKGGDQLVEHGSAQGKANLPLWLKRRPRLTAVNVPIWAILRIRGDAGAKVSDQPVNGVRLSEVNHLHLVGLARGQHEGQVTGRLPLAFAPAGHGLEVKDIEADELYEDDSFGQRQRDGAAVGLVKLLFEVQFRNLAGQGRFALLLLLSPLVQGLLVGREGFAGRRPGERLPRDAPAKLGELVERFTQVRIAPTEHRVALRHEGFSAENLAAKKEVESQSHDFGRVRKMPVDEGQEAFLFPLVVSQEEQSLLVGAYGEHLTDRTVGDSIGLLHQRQSFVHSP
jgi:hypothetical protein